MYIYLFIFQTFYMNLEFILDKWIQRKAVSTKKQGKKLFMIIIFILYQQYINFAVFKTMNLKNVILLGSTRIQSIYRYYD